MTSGSSTTISPKLTTPATKDDSRPEPALAGKDSRPHYAWLIAIAILLVVTIVIFGICYKVTKVARRVESISTQLRSPVDDITQNNDNVLMSAALSASPDDATSLTDLLTVASAASPSIFRHRTSVTQPYMYTQPFIGEGTSKTLSSSLRNTTAATPSNLREHFPSASRANTDSASHRTSELRSPVSFRRHDTYDRATCTDDIYRSSIVTKVSAGTTSQATPTSEPPGAATQEVKTDAIVLQTLGTSTRFCEVSAQQNKDSMYLKGELRQCSAEIDSLRTPVSSTQATMELTSVKASVQLTNELSVTEIKSQASESNSLQEAQLPPSSETSSQTYLKAPCLKTFAPSLVEGLLPAADDVQKYRDVTSAASLELPLSTNDVIPAQSRSVTDRRNMSSNTQYDSAVLRSYPPPCSIESYSDSPETERHSFLRHHDISTMDREHNQSLWTSCQSGRNVHVDVEKDKTHLLGELADRPAVIQRHSPSPTRDVTSALTPRALSLRTNDVYQNTDDVGVIDFAEFRHHVSPVRDERSFDDTFPKIPYGFLEKARLSSRENVADSEQDKRVPRNRERKHPSRPVNMLNDAPETSVSSHSRLGTSEGACTGGSIGSRLSARWHSSESIGTRSSGE